MSGEFDWTGTYTAEVNAQSVADAGDHTSGAISNDGKLATKVGITVAYGGTANEGVKVFVLGLVDGTNYEAEADDPWGFEMPFSTATTHRRTFVVPAGVHDSFKILATNDSGAQITLDVDYDQATAAA